MSAHWVKIANSIAELPFNENGLAEAVAGSKTICIGKANDRLFAFARKCPHASGLLVAGWIDAMGNVVCPLHRYKFCMANGRNVSGEGYNLKHWPVEERSDGIWVQLKDQGLLDLLGNRQ
jgi:nitrite reductase/ring-hydroxylating ferredoxin subunit